MIMMHDSGKRQDCVLFSIFLVTTEMTSVEKIVIPEVNKLTTAFHTNFNSYHVI